MDALYFFGYALSHYHSLPLPITALHATLADAEVIFDTDDAESSE